MQVNAESLCQINVNYFCQIMNFIISKGKDRTIEGHEKLKLKWSQFTNAATKLDHVKLNANWRHLSAMAKGLTTSFQSDTSRLTELQRGQNICVQTAGAPAEKLLAYLRFS